MKQTHVAQDRKGRNMGERPEHLRPPTHLSPSPPVPEPAEVHPEPEPDDRPPPTRYGDWERNGIAIDF